MKLAMLLFTLAIILSRCDMNIRHKTSLQPPDSSSHIVDWSYSGESSPEHWAELEIGSDCDGKRQSPINIIDIETEHGSFTNELVSIQYQNVSSIESITNNGHTIQYNFNTDSNVIRFKEGDYTLKQFHFHSPAEHTVNGIRYPLEIHMVHHNEASNSYLVFSILVMQGEPDTTFSFIEKFLPIEQGETKPINGEYCFGGTHPEMFKVDSVDVFTYQGSLTTPPCSENVLWMIIKKPIHASAKQIEELQRLMPKNNYRASQPLNSRKVYHESITNQFKMMES